MEDEATSGSVQTLPADLLHLLSEQLCESADFPTLYSCVVSSRHLASAGAVSGLYRICHESPVKGGGNEGLSLAEQELNVQKWSILWRTIILSALGKTTYPYCRHMRMLDLRDLGNLLEDDKFRGRISKTFFADDLNQFYYVASTSGKGRTGRLDPSKIIRKIGDRVSQHTPLLDGLSEPSMSNILSEALPEWAPNVTYLRRLDFFDGKALASETTRNLLHAHCPNLEVLDIYRSSGPDMDHALAAFIGGMPPNKLIHFETQGECGIAAETCLALNHHGQSLKTLQLTLSEEGMLALALLQDCTSIEKLSISTERPSIDLKATQNDVYLEIVHWLTRCTALKDVSFNNVVSAPDLVMPVLVNQNVRLTGLDINANKEEAMYVVKDHHDFHQALSRQSHLRQLYLRADPEPMTRDDIEKLMNTLCSLTSLQELKLIRISDYFSDEHVDLLANHLPNLVDLYIGGYGISDAVFSGISKLRLLKTLSFSGITNFTTEGITGFIERLSDGNAGLVLSVDNADPDSALSADDQDRLRRVIQEKVDGRFEYQLLRDPNMPEFDSEYSD